MTENRPTNLRPSACFIVERALGKGYQVTSAEGSHADELKSRALALLDALGQPDPKGPAEYSRWLGPIAPSGEFVGVSVKLMPNGEARYHQAWFSVPKRATRLTRSNVLQIFVLLLVFAAGAVVGRSFLVPDRSANAGKGEPLGTGNLDPPVMNTAPDVRATMLEKELVSSRDLRAKLSGYLSQEGFAANATTTVVDERRSVKLIADLDKTPPPTESIRLSNIEVAKLMKLFETLDEWTAANPGAAPKSEGR